MSFFATSAIINTKTHETQNEINGTQTVLELAAQSTVYWWNGYSTFSRHSFCYTDSNKRFATRNDFWADGLSKRRCQCISLWFPHNFSLLYWVTRAKILRNALAGSGCTIQIREIGKWIGGIRSTYEMDSAHFTNTLVQFRQRSAIFPPAPPAYFQKTLWKIFWQFTLHCSTLTDPKCTTSYSSCGLNSKHNTK